MQYRKVQDHDNLVRDTHSKAVINTDRAALENHRRKQNRINRLEQRQNKIESDLDEIKSMISVLINNGKSQ